MLLQQLWIAFEKGMVVDSQMYSFALILYCFVVDWIFEYLATVSTKNWQYSAPLTQKLKNNYFDFSSTYNFMCVNI